MFCTDFKNTEICFVPRDNLIPPHIPFVLTLQICCCRAVWFVSHPCFIRSEEKQFRSLKANPLITIHLLWFLRHHYSLYFTILYKIITEQAISKINSAKCFFENLKPRNISVCVILIFQSIPHLLVQIYNNQNLNCNCSKPRATRVSLRSTECILTELVSMTR